MNWNGIKLWHSMALLGSQGVIRWAGVGYDMIHWTLFIVARLAEAHIPSLVGLS